MSPRVSVTPASASASAADKLSSAVFKLLSLYETSETTLFSQIHFLQMILYYYTIQWTLTAS